MKKYILPSLASFVVIFNLGYVFHEIIVFDYFKTHIGAISRENYIIPLIALAFITYTSIQSYLIPIFIKHHSNLSPGAVGLRYGALLGFLWDGLQGGIIEVATFKMPISIFFIDSSYHTFEGALSGFIIAKLYMKLSQNPI